MAWEGFCYKLDMAESPASKPATRQHRSKARSLCLSLFLSLSTGKREKGGLAPPPSCARARTRSSWGDFVPPTVSAWEARLYKGKPPLNDCMVIVPPGRSKQTTKTEGKAATK